MPEMKNIICTFDDVQEDSLQLPHQILVPFKTVIMLINTGSCHRRQHNGMFELE